MLAPFLFFTRANPLFLVPGHILGSETRWDVTEDLHSMMDGSGIVSISLHNTPCLFKKFFSTQSFPMDNNLLLLLRWALVVEARVSTVYEGLRVLMPADVLALSFPFITLASCRCWHCCRKTVRGCECCSDSLMERGDYWICGKNQ